MEKMKKPIKKLAKVRVRKMHLDYVAGLLSIPLIIMGLVLNYNNLHNKNNNTPSPTPQIVIEHPQATPTINTTPQTCTKIVGPISISSPNEGDTVTDNPVCVTISYPNTNYCSAVWSYRINNGSWSEYTSNNPCLYNVPNGPVKFELRVQSTASSDTKTLTRNFTYEGSPIPTATPIASSSAQ